MSEINNGGLDQYGTEPFEQQQFGTAGVEGVNPLTPSSHSIGSPDSELQDATLFLTVFLSKFPSRYFSFTGI